MARFLAVTRTTVLLGRRQEALAIDAHDVARLGWDLRRRLTPGGLVYMDVTAVCLELALPASHPEFTGDVLWATRWFGTLVADALRGLGIPVELAASNGPPPSGPVGQACFASWVRGEVLLGARKVFGTAQYRRRSGALFQGVGLTAGSHARIAAVLPAPPAGRAEAAATVDRFSAPLDVPFDALREAVRTAVAAAEVHFEG